MSEAPTSPTLAVPVTRQGRQWWGVSVEAWCFHVMPDALNRKHAWKVLRTCDAAIHVGGCAESPPSEVIESCGVRVFILVAADACPGVPFGGPVPADKLCGPLHRWMEEASAAARTFEALQWRGAEDLWDTRGAALDRRARDFGGVRHPGESDDDFRMRVAKAAGALIVEPLR